jgi:RNA-directed DNA polymerase
VWLEDARTQLPQTAGARPRAAVKPKPEPRHEQALTAPHEQSNPGAGDLLRQALARENMARAWKRVKANKGSAGVDGRTVHDTGEHLKAAWPDIRQSLLDGGYRPSAVRRVGIPKPGGGMRELGIPTVVDRLIQQALLQVLQPIIDPTFSEHSYGFRPGRSAHAAVLKAQQYVQQGHEVVVDVDLEKFFDRVNHDILMDRLAKRIADKRVLRLIRRYLQAGILEHGVSIEREQGTPQGGPLSPLLANVLLDEVDRELERRGHKFVRYADDCNVYVRSLRAGERVLQALRGCYAKLRLKVNEAKTAVAPVWERKFLGYRVLRTSRGEVKLGLAHQSLHTLKDRIRELTRVTVGRSAQQVAQDLRRYIPGWRAYFALVQTPTVLTGLDGWLRTRLRVLQLRHWRHGSTIYRELRKLGASDSLARRVASRMNGWWRTAATGLRMVLTVEHFARMGVPRFS